MAAAAGGSDLPAPSGAPTWPDLLTGLLARRDLDRSQTAWAMGRVMAGEAGEAQLAGFLVALRAKGESVEELDGLVAAMLAHAVRIEVPGPTVDVVGTGGDRHHSVNISTMAALVVAGTGRRVVKHGNRAASSSSGSADVLEALGVRLDLPPARVAELAGEVGITFCFAQVFHPAFRHAAAARRGLGVPTALNFLGPLTNPAQPPAAAVGVSDARMAPLMAGVLAGRGASALVFRGRDGLDELSTTGPSQVWSVGGRRVVEHVVDPADVGLPRATLADLRGGDAEVNAAAVRRLLTGEPGPVRDAVLLNAAAGVLAHDRIGGLAGTRTRVGDPEPGPEPGPEPAPEPDLVSGLRAGLVEAARAVDSGAAGEVLDRWVTASRA